MMADRRENTHAINLLARWIDRTRTGDEAPEGMSLARVKALADPDTVHLAQTVTCGARALHVGYNLDGRMVRVVESRNEPQEFKYLPHLFYLGATEEGYAQLRAVAQRGGYLQND